MDKVKGDSGKRIADMIKKAMDDHQITTTEYEKNYYIVVSVECMKCKSNISVFDNTKHGWNGFICHDENIDSAKRPLYNEWICTECKSKSHDIEININSQGQKDFTQEAGDEYEPNDWVEAFDWITIKTKCNSCNKEYNNWISYETM